MYTYKYLPGLYRKMQDMKRSVSQGSPHSSLLTVLSPCFLDYFFSTDNRFVIITFLKRGGFMKLMALKLHSGKLNGVLIYALVLCLGLGMLAFPRESYGAAEKYTVRYMTIEGAEGAELPAHVYVPAGPVPEGGFPAVIFIHSWCLNEFEYETKLQEFAKNGYITICYTCRGWYFVPGENDVAGPLEMQDLNNVVDWLLANTPVDPDNIGSTGISYGGGQSLLALKFEPRIKTVVPMSGWTDLYESLAPNHSMKLGWSAFLLASGYTMARPSDTMASWLTAILSDTNVEETLESLAVRSPVTFLDDINSRRPVPPVFIVQGINDDLFTSRQMVDFHQHYRGRKKIILANGVHGSAEIPGLLTFPSSIWDQTSDWFDYWLKGEDNGIMDDAPVSIYRNWTKSQAEFDEWPVTNDSISLYPANEYIKGKLSKRGSLNSSETADEQSVTLKNTPLSMSATSGMFFLSPALQSYLDVYVTGSDPSGMGKGTVTFQTETLAEDTIVMGTPRIKFLVRPDKDIFQLNFFIYDVNKSGTAKLVSHLPYTGWRCSPGEINQVDVEMNVLAHKFEAGHRIRLVVTTSDIVYVMPVREDFDVELFWGGNTGSSLELPVL